VMANIIINMTFYQPLYARLTIFYKYDISPTNLRQADHFTS